MKLRKTKKEVLISIKVDFLTQIVYVPLKTLWTCWDRRSRGPRDDLPIDDERWPRPKSNPWPGCRNADKASLREQKHQQPQQHSDSKCWYREWIKRSQQTNQKISYTKCEDDIDELDQPKRCKLWINCLLIQYKCSEQLAPNTEKGEPIKAHHEDVGVVTRPSWSYTDGAVPPRWGGHGAGIQMKMERSYLWSWIKQYQFMEDSSITVDFTNTAAVLGSIFTISN